VLFAFKSLVEKNMEELAHLLSSEHGKVIADSKGDIQRGLEVIEFACGIPHALKGEYTEGAGPGIDVYSMRQPLGVVAGITPFNFPAMIPMWMFGVAIACGNTFILKPSEKDPSVPVRLAELMMEAGAPAGVLNVVHGDKEAVDAIIEHPDIRRSASSARPTSLTTSTATAPRTISACKPWAAPRTTASFCPTLTWIKS
jgi:malonate-semialdehyde dehydrogenase (acetylating)/methylmalonate-semialdehyde dehydrogenase